VPIPDDVSDADAVRDLVARIVERFGRLDAVVANAGAMFTGSVAETSLTDWNAARCSGELREPRLGAHRGVRRRDGGVR
jgi:NAD(P)-dependent dehydrogenase (short-subunit alcohol dehydrogenase family)